MDTLGLCIRGSTWMITYEMLVGGNGGTKHGDIILSVDLEED